MTAYPRGASGRSPQPTEVLMTAYMLTNHLLNFVAPAAFVALLLVLLVRLVNLVSRSKKAAGQSLWAQMAIIFIANSLVLVVGAVLSENDGRMATYAAMVVVAAVCQWIMLRSWKS
jgi:hypothetical protein